MSAFAEPLAQARRGLAAYLSALRSGERETQQLFEDGTLALAALNLIEQRATDMEKALREIEKFGGKAWFDAQETARAVLSAREEAR